MMGAAVVKSTMGTWRSIGYAKMREHCWLQLGCAKGILKRTAGRCIGLSARADAAGEEAQERQFSEMMAASADAAAERMDGGRA